MRRVHVSTGDASSRCSAKVLRRHASTAKNAADVLQFLSRNDRAPHLAPLLC